MAGKNENNDQPKVIGDDLVPLQTDGLKPDDQSKKDIFETFGEDSGKSGGSKKSK